MIRTTAPARVPALALLPLRFFFGVTFLFAGFDKLLDPAFFDAPNSRSIQAQLGAFERLSPLGPVIALSRPYAVEIGLLIAIAEIAVGLGALSGVAYRLVAVGGAALSLLFWLTVSWATRPFYLGSDLPYAVGWLTLALAGSGGVLVVSWPQSESPAGARNGPSRVAAGPLVDRRAVLEAGALAAASVAAAALAVPLRILGISTGIASPEPKATPGAAATPVPSAVPSATPAGPSSAPLTIATVAELERAPSRSFTVPFAAPAPLPAGDPGIVVKLAAGTYVAFDAICTHAGCTVDWDPIDHVLLCPCHDAAFDAANNGAVLAGPAELPLTSLPIVIDQVTGQISLRA